MNRVNVRVADFTANTKSANNGLFDIKKYFQFQIVLRYVLTNKQFRFIQIELFTLHITTTLVMVIGEKIVQLQFNYVIST